MLLSVMSPKKKLDHFISCLNSLLQTLEFTAAMMKSSGTLHGLALPGFLYPHPDSLRPAVTFVHLLGPSVYSDASAPHGTGSVSLCPEYFPSPV